MLVRKGFGVSLESDVRSHLAGGDWSGCSLCCSGTGSVCSGPVAVFFIFAVVFLVEPHLHRVRRPSYDEYCQHVPRWFDCPDEPGFRFGNSTVTLADNGSDTTRNLLY